MSGKGTARLVRAPAAALAMDGVFWGGWAGLMPDMKAQAGASDGAFGLVMMLSAVAAVIAMGVAPRLVQAAGRAALPLAGALLCLSFLPPIFATDIPSLAVAVFVMGAGVALLDISGNIRISAIEAATGASLMNFAHAMFSFAFGLAAIGVGVAREAGYGPGTILPGLAVAAAALGCMLYERRADWHPPERHADGTKGPRDPVYWKVALLTAAVLFSSFVGENATEAWSALHIERTLHAAVGHGSFGPAVLGLVMGTARLGGHAAVRLMGERATIAWSAALGALGALVIAAAWSPGVVYAGVGVVAMGVAVIVPSANTVLGRRISGPWRAHALSRAWMVGMSGFFVGPAVMGMVSEATSLRAAYVVIACVIAATIPAIFALGRIPPLARAATPGAGRSF